MFVSHHYQATSIVPTAQSSYTLQIIIKREWVIYGQHFPLSYLLPQNVYSAEMWMWDALYTFPVCKTRNETTYLEVSASCADRSCLPGQLNHFSMFSHTTFRKAHTNSTPHYTAHLHIQVEHWVSTKRCSGIQHTYHLTY